MYDLKAERENAMCAEDDARRAALGMAAYWTERSAAQAKLAAMFADNGCSSAAELFSADAARYAGYAEHERKLIDGRS